MTGNMGKAKRVAAKRDLALEALRTAVRQVDRSLLSPGPSLLHIVSPLLRAGQDLIQEESSITPRRRGPR